MVYLFIGQDSPAKDTQFNKIKQDLLAKEVEDFNLDILFARDLTLKKLQERILCLPVKSPARIVLIREAESLKEEIKEFVLRYAAKPQKRLCLILDMHSPLKERKDGFLNRLLPYVKIMRFKQEPEIDAFTLARQIGSRQADSALRVLSRLLSQGERPERILGGLRFAFEKEGFGWPQARKRLKLLLACDIDMKSGRLKPDFALEKLVVSLCGLGKPQH